MQTNNDILKNRFAHRDEIRRLLREAVHTALREHKAAGNVVAFWQQEAVALVPPEEIPVPENEEEPE